eukprot:SAG11_NODE_29439_length_310_cov_8.341232_1_plen_78_part_01
MCDTKKYLLGDAKYWRIFGRGNFFQVPTVGFTTYEYTYGIALYLGYTIRVLRKIAYIQKFREKKSPKFCMQPAGGHHC